MESPDFENAIVKIMKGALLSATETRLMKKFEIKTVAENSLDEGSFLLDSFVVAPYVDLQWIPCTSNACE